MRPISRRSLISAGLALALLAAPAMAEQFSTNTDNIALEGYDPVAYFTQSRPVEGSAEFRTQWQDVTWQFSSQEHKTLFEENPEKFAPRYGGYCAGGMSLGRKSKIDPQAWMIVDGKLFLGGSQSAIDYMKKDTDGKIANADKNWQTLGVTN